MHNTSICSETEFGTLLLHTVWQPGSRTLLVAESVTLESSATHGEAPDECHEESEESGDADNEESEESNADKEVNPELIVTLRLQNVSQISRRRQNGRHQWSTVSPALSTLEELGQEDGCGPSLVSKIEYFCA